MVRVGLFENFGEKEIITERVLQGDTVAVRVSREERVSVTLEERVLAGMLRDVEGDPVATDDRETERDFLGEEEMTLDLEPDREILGDAVGRRLAELEREARTEGESLGVELTEGLRLKEIVAAREPRALALRKADFVEEADAKLLKVGTTPFTSPSSRVSVNSSATTSTRLDLPRRKIPESPLVW